jgi:hypothetical protein
VIGLFRQKSPGNIIALLVFGLLLKLPLFLQPLVLTAPYDGPGFRALAGILPNGGTVAGIIAFVLLYLQALMLNYSVNEFRMTSRQTFLPGMAYMLVTSLVPEWNYLSAPLVAGTLILLAFARLFHLYNVQGANSKIFNIGLLVGLASFFYFPAIFFLLAILPGFMILRPFRLNEFFLFLLGVLSPYYFYLAYLFLYEKLQWNQVLPKFVIHDPQGRPGYWLLASIVLLGIPFLMGGFYIQTQLRKMLIQARKNWSVFLLFLLLALLIPFVTNDDTYTPWVLVAAPVAGFHACAYLYPPRKWLSTVLFVIMVLFVIALQYGDRFLS